MNSKFVLLGVGVVILSIVATNGVAVPNATAGNSEGGGLTSRVTALETAVTILRKTNDIQESRLDIIETESLPPLGSIVASYLPYERMPASFKQHWLPCDGRNGTPDLRGVFLRGLNHFEVGKSRRDRKTKGDPEGDLRKVGSWQNDELRSHSHTFPGEWKTDGRSGGAKSIVVDENARLKSVNKLLRSTGGAESRPRNVAVYYYARVK